MTEEIKINISKTISTSIFETPEVEKRLEELFAKTRKCLHYHFNEIKNYACSKEGGVATLDACQDIKIDDLQAQLRKRILTRAMAEAIELSLSDDKTNYNIKDSLLKILTEERFKNIGKEEIPSAFGDVVLTLPETEEIDQIIKEGVACRIKSKFKLDT